MSTDEPGDGAWGALEDDDDVPYPHRKPISPMTPQDRAKALVQSFRYDDHGDYDLSFIWLEQTIAQALHAERVTAWEEAAKVACPMCAKGYPLQKNGGWHNDMNNKDTLMNNLCRGADCRDQAHKEQP